MLDRIAPRTKEPESAALGYEGIPGRSSKNSRLATILLRHSSASAGRIVPKRSQTEGGWGGDGHLRCVRGLSELAEPALPTALAPGPYREAVSFVPLMTICDGVSRRQSTSSTRHYGPP
jgi:hypothetical protein